MSETVDFATSLLERPSITPADAGCQTLIAERLQKIGFEITSFPINQVSNLWARRGHAAPHFCFAGHTDVVPPGDLSQWRSDPFAPTVENGKLYARGAADMKSSVAAMVTACERFIAKYPHHEGSISFLITSDEEGMAQDGTQAVLKILHERQEMPNWCLVGEASSTDTLGDTIKIGRRGSLTGELKIFGKQGHVAYPHLAKNPIHHAFAPLQAIASQVWDKGTENFGPTTLQFANIHSGTGTNNVIPGTLEANFNLRFSPAITPEQIQQTVKQILQEHDCEYELKWRLSGKPFYTAPQSTLIQAVTSTISQTVGRIPLHSTSGGTSDGRFFAEYGVEVVEFGPNNATIHQVNECIAIEELVKLSLVYEAILVSLFGQPHP